MPFELRIISALLFTACFRRIVVFCLALINGALVECKLYPPLSFAASRIDGIDMYSYDSDVGSESRR